MFGGCSRQCFDSRSQNFALRLAAPVAAHVSSRVIVSIVLAVIVVTALKFIFEKLDVRHLRFL